MGALIEKSTEKLIIERYHGELSIRPLLKEAILNAPISSFFLTVTFLVMSVAYFYAPVGTLFPLGFQIGMLICFWLYTIMFDAETNSTFLELRNVKEQSLYDELCRSINFNCIDPYGIISSDADRAFFSSSGAILSIVGILLSLALSIFSSVDSKAQTQAFVYIAGIMFLVFVVILFFSYVSKDQHKIFKEWLLRCCQSA
ncbi:hypothetical protein [Mariprofundus ferrooxydans]|uniref:hypothetical protein n=1 Tax=Mariprofundus ferrooxydans TaxID=314344 RepID=UPI0014300718|nr:hypothetical protein [Mariprofundus ferrooxydans]